MPIIVGQDTSSTRKTLEVNGKTYAYYSIPAAEAAGLGTFSNLPAALKVVLENMLRFEDGKTVSVDDVKAFSDWVFADCATYAGLNYDQLFGPQLVRERTADRAVLTITLNAVASPG